jgi:Lipopolysaccharide kinase (Kdo/WaaP) family
VGQMLAPLEAKPLQERIESEQVEIKQLREEKKQLRDKEKLLLLRGGEAASQSGELANAFENLSLQPSVVKVSWGKPNAASNFALSAQSWESLNLMLCLSHAGFWQPPSPHLAEDVGETRRVFGALCGCETYSPCCLEKVSETRGESSVDAVMVERLRTVFSSSRFECTERGGQQTMEQLGCRNGPTSGSSKPDFTVRVDGLVVLVAEFKNNATAPIEQLPQAAASCCNVVLAQYGAGLAVEDCRCDVLLSNGHLFQFAVVTLLPPCMPKLVLTSRVLDHSDHADALGICERLAWLTAFCSKKREFVAAREIPAAFLLDQQKYHEKPAGKWLRQDRSIKLAEHSYVRIFEKLWPCEEVRPCVVFPEGFLRDKGQLRSIVFEKLDGSWYIGMPSDDELHELFLQKLGHIVKLVHACNVVHMDLMPCNIAWKKGQDGKSVLIKLLDFDAATNLPFRIGDQLQDLTLTNRREYMWSETLSPNVRFDCWYCFLYGKMPSKCRVFAPVSGESSPGEVNGPFLEWLALQNVRDLRSEFAGLPLLSQELNLSIW